MRWTCWCAGWLGALVFLSCVPDTAKAASFDCKLARSAQEKAICASPDLSRADEAMAAAYKAALQRNTAGASALKASQLSWLQETKLRCHAQVAAQPVLTSCLLARYKDRILTLQDGRQHLLGIAFGTASKTLHFANTKDDSPDVEGKTVGTLHAVWPVADSRAPEWAAWNAAVEQATRDISNSDSDSRTGQQSTQWQPRWAEAVDADVSAGEVSSMQFGPALGTLVSVRIGNEFMGFGAAHPGEVWTHFHWLLEKRRTLRASDIFAPGSPWKAVFTRACMASLARQTDVGYDKETELSEVKKQAPLPENWSIDEEGITVEFPEYTVSARAAPAEPVLIRWSLLKPHLVAGLEVAH